MNERKTAVKILDRVERDGAYSNLELSNVLSEREIDGKNSAFISALVYGTLERKLTLDYIINKHSSRKARDIDLTALNALRVGTYQLVFMDKVPSFSAVNETVEALKELKGEKAAGFANAVLRAIERDKNAARVSEKDELTGISRAYSVSRDIVNMLAAEYGMDNAKKILKTTFGRAPVTVRVNTLKTNKNELKEQLSKFADVSENSLDENALDIKYTGRIDLSEPYVSGLFHVQDISSQLCAKALGAVQGERILDMCSAPGGKAFTAAQYMKNTGEIIACDLYPSRVRLIKDGAVRLGEDIITAVVSDSSVYNEKLGKFDRVLCDVPCSGTGVMRRKPEIRYKTKDDINMLLPTQKAIIENASAYVKTGGVLLYSTCSLNTEENGKVTDEFLKNHPNFEETALFEDSNESEKTFLPHIDGTDGFYIRKFKKIF